MEENNDKPETNVKATIDAVTGLVKAVPVYQDVLQPSAKQIGQSLEIVTKTVNIALAPIKALVWGYEKIEEVISTSVSEKLKNVLKENITTPPLQVAGPAIEALRFSGHDINLRELYANLLATAMDKTTIHKAHPGFVEVIKNMASDEALLIQCFIRALEYPIIDIHSKYKDPNKGYTIAFGNYSHFHKIVVFQQPELVPAYINNLCRLGLLEIPFGMSFAKPYIYDLFEVDTVFIELKEQIEKDLERVISLKPKTLKLTAYGKQFVDSVVKDKNNTDSITGFVIWP
ncbi:MAG: DUF4393 domain-containing protein [Bacteroidota bacterium]|nr:DUF4393 domain-containing protein [Bacteroidota bacterium]